MPAGQLAKMEIVRIYVARYYFGGMEMIILVKRSSEIRFGAFS